jgi:hypothetical protein
MLLVCETDAKGFSCCKALELSQNVFFYYADNNIFIYLDFNTWAYGAQYDILTLCAATTCRESLRTGIRPIYAIVETGLMGRVFSENSVFRLYFPFILCFSFVLFFLHLSMHCSVQKVFRREIIEKSQEFFNVICWDWTRAVTGNAQCHLTLNQAVESYNTEHDHSFQYKVCSSLFYFIFLRGLRIGVFMSHRNRQNISPDHKCCHKSRQANLARNCRGPIKHCSQ